LAEYSLFYRALLQERPIILRSLPSSADDKESDECTYIYVYISLYTVCNTSLSSSLMMRMVAVIKRSAQHSNPKTIEDEDIYLCISLYLYLYISSYTVCNIYIYTPRIDIIDDPDHQTIWCECEVNVVRDPPRIHSRSCRSLLAHSLSIPNSLNYAQIFCEVNCK